MSSQLSFSASPSLKRRRSSYYGPSQASSAGGRKGRAVRRARFTRAVAERIPTFVETYAAGQFTAGNAGGVWQPRLSVLPELADYTALYRSYRIKKIDIIVMPNNVAATGSPSGVTQMAFAVDPSAELPAPTSLQDVLNNNNVRLVQLDKPVRISFRPVPSVEVGIAGAGATGISMSPQWLSLDNGSAVSHNGVSYWFYNTGTATTCQVYFRYTFQLKDPR